jgi:hypothetical protein
MKPIFLAGKKLNLRTFGQIALDGKDFAAATRELDLRFVTLKAAAHGGDTNGGSLSRPTNDKKLAL